MDNSRIRSILVLQYFKRLIRDKSMSKMIKSRFCPSPTGLLHLGNVRTALFNTLLANGQHGIFLVRIEDTDKARSTQESADALQVDMKWLGLDWDEGPGKDKGAGPYWQSQRQSIYDHYYQILEQKGLVYPCFCSEQQLAIARKIQLSTGKPPRYSGTCRSLTQEVVSQKLAAGLQPALRFRVPQNQQTVFDDLVRGQQSFDNNDIGDFIIRRADGTPPFMYCNAIDDALMGVTHALRGEDHLTNTPRQIMILQALDLPVPTYGHISLIIGSDGSPLSKRTGSRSVQELREQGFWPIAVVNYLARLGHYYPEGHFMSFEELASKFSLSSLSGAPARFDYHQLLHWQREALLHAQPEQIWQWMGETVHDHVPDAHKDLFIKTITPNILFPNEAAHWVWLIYSQELGYSEVSQAILKEANPDYFKIALEVIANGGLDYQKIIETLKSKLHLKGKALFQPLRVALTNELHGPELAPLIELIGMSQVKRRLENVSELLN